MKILRLFLLICFVGFISGCEQHDRTDSIQPTMAVTYSTLNGTWELIQWNGSPIAEGTDLYIVFDSSTQRFTIWDNINSMYITQTTGEFVIEQDDYDRYILSGWYDYGVGDWNNKYAVTLSYPGEHMEWMGINEDDKMVFHRVETLPEFN